MLLKQNIVSRSTKLRWKRLGTSIVALNFHPKFRPRRQNITNEYVENGMFYFASRQLLEKGYFQSRRYVSNKKYTCIVIHTIMLAILNQRLK